VRTEPAQEKRAECDRLDGQWDRAHERVEWGQQGSHRRTSVGWSGALLLPAAQGTFAMEYTLPTLPDNYHTPRAPQRPW